MKNQQNPKPAMSESFALMTPPENAPANIGSLVIHEGAVATIVKRVVASVPGVARLSGSSFIDNIAEIVRSKKIQDRAIVLAFHGSSVSVEVSINVFFGNPLPPVAAEVQKSVSAAISDLTGLLVESVNVNIRDVEEPVSPEEHAKDGEEK